MSFSLRGLNHTARDTFLGGKVTLATSATSKQGHRGRNMFPVLIEQLVMSKSLSEAM